METRFPISRDSGQVHVSFVWYDAFRHSKKTEQCSIHFEKASVLFNLAAILTQQALNADRATDAGRKEAAKFRLMNGGVGRVPVVIRGPQGGGVRLAAQHSQSLEAWFQHIPGLVVIAPSTPYDAKGLLAAAIRAGPIP